MKLQHWAAVLGIAFLLSVGILGYAFTARPAPSAAAEALQGGAHDLKPLFPAPSFAYRDHRGALVTPASLKGTPYIANFVFTTCRTICPLLTAKMVQLQRQLDNVGVRFLSFSVDPEHDTPEALAAYATRWNASEDRWSLLATDATTLPLTAAGFHVTAAKNAMAGSIDPILHSAVFVLVDGEGLVRGIYDSEDRPDFQALLADARSLAHASPALPATAARTGEQLYHQLSCAGCHERPALAPSLHGLAGRRVELEASNLVIADRAYVKESILAPDLKRVRGYPLRMPTYDGVISPAELDTLTDYVLAMPQQSAAADPAAHTEVDPVCDMAVRVDPEVPHAAFEGREFYFCSEQCRTDFLKTPKAFAAKAAHPR
jgi:protein SCO1/2